MTNASRPPVPPPPPPPPPRVAPPPPPPVAGRPPSPPPIGNNEQTLPINMAPPRVAPPPAPTAPPPRVAPPPPAANTVTTPAPPSTVVQSGPPSAPVAAQVVAPPAKRKPSPGQPTMIDIVKRADEEGCSDIHLGVNEVPRFRKRGDIVPLDYPTTDLDTFMSWLGEIMSEEDIAFFQENLDYDGAADLGFVRIRISCFDSLAGPAMVLRLIGATILSMEQLNLPPVFRDVCHYHKGLILVTGPTGSGKSTTMAAMFDYINKSMAKHIITIEDPVEFVHVSQKSLIKHREVGRHTRQFFNALKGALRQDPDIMLVGEIRDAETMKIALKAASTGHLVCGTLHTNSAIKTIERVLGMFPPNEHAALRVSLAESLVAIIAQGLCKTTDGKRAAYHDILIATDAIKEYIIKGEMEEINQVMLKSEFDGMITMNKALFNLYQEGRITEEVALENSPTPNEMAQFLRGRV
ncbi:type IV pilus twitching motility protein PilT [Limnothrix sp. FACHB-881]|uniref:type IV pilus twitching motility protein PilT n=2 Tax=Limnothrix TaxID=132605 RepID=UPI001680F320|nr:MULTISPECIES: type IV pilus twitching motility protein PilT [unclassified Limnothrix]MBD2162568.1 type IV pilus twitching motility protein PilT [Limnothrix sp. FACHB-1083]MBD2193624.1 type IV pilus twitching motility protein PilT [Limnothrix sp. FACHB-1088]MBD2554667.1 type IV pilus twitching motility protein PilT [Limnothrix sp. FACHB-708]MBD2591700.1 type IV pilus twitching motility protein PilT [Limnothrix sp. FACHB-406]MBD2635752.1 type IV pilus twitching motility protein PilT [Limnothr